MAAVFTDPQLLSRDQAQIVRDGGGVASQNQEGGGEERDHRQSMSAGYIYYLLSIIYYLKLGWFYRTILLRLDTFFAIAVAIKFAPAAEIPVKPAIVPCYKFSSKYIVH